MGDYQRLQTDSENDGHPPVLPQNVCPPQKEWYSKRPSSFLHKVAFVASIAFCFVVVVSFLWILPCDFCPCEGPQEGSSGFLWNRTLSGLELKGQLHFVDGNLIGILRGALWGLKSETGASRQAPGQVVSLLGKTGDVSWYAVLQTVPTHLDCTILAIDSSGVKECLALGDNGYLVSINSASGIITWKLKVKNSSFPEPRNIDMPLAITDMDNDGVVDLVSLSRFQSPPQKLLFISGRSGVVLDEPPLATECDNVHNLTYDSSAQKLFYTCTSNNDYFLRVKSYDLPKREKVEKKRSPKWDSSSSEHRIIVRNTGTCPTFCTVSINVTDVKNRTIWSWQKEKAYVMLPVPLHLKPSITGFLLKLWHWQPSSHHAPKGANGLKVELINERIILITFSNKGDMHVVNASQTDITQFCNNSHCQPELPFQTPSALIADLNEDNSQDLISHYVTYKLTKSELKNSTIDDWELLTSVKVIRLGDELPKLYEAVSKH